MSFFNKYLLSHCAFILIAVSSSAQQAPSSVVHLTEKNEPGKPFTLDIKVLDIDSKEPVAESRYLPIIQIQKEIMKVLLKVLHVFMELR